MTTTDDIASLCRAIDDGDDSALGILADAMEEAQQDEVTGLREIARRGYRPAICGMMSFSLYGWVPASLMMRAGTCHIPPGPFSMLKGGARPFEDCGWYYRSRSEAFLALAQALAESSCG